MTTRNAARFGTAAVLMSALALSATGCRTNLTPLYREKTQEKYRGEKHCTVREFGGAADLPANAKNMGWVMVPEQEGGDLATQEALIQKICEMGGDAYTAPAWVKDDAGKQQMKANVWELP